MKRLRRIIFHSLTVLSLLLCVGMVTLWTASWKWPRLLVTESAELPTPATWRSQRIEQATWVLLARGGLEFRLYRMSGKPLAAVGPRSWNLSAVQSPKLLADQLAQPSIWNRLGFAFQTSTPGGSYLLSRAGRRASCCIVGLPFWFLVMLAGILPFWWLAQRWRAWRRRRAGLCPVCAYDLRATPDRCPECGTVPAKVAK